jgi:hypothetical protein
LSWLGIATAASLTTFQDAYNLIDVSPIASEKMLDILGNEKEIDNFTALLIPIMELEAKRRYREDFGLPLNKNPNWRSEKDIIMEGARNYLTHNHSASIHTEKPNTSQNDLQYNQLLNQFRDITPPHITIKEIVKYVQHNHNLEIQDFHHI